MINVEEMSNIRNRAIMYSEKTKYIIFAFSNNQILKVVDPAHARFCVETQNKKGGYLIGRFKNGKEI